MASANGNVSTFACNVEGRQFVCSLEGVRCLSFSPSTWRGPRGTAGLAQVAAKLRRGGTASLDTLLPCKRPSSRYCPSSLLLFSDTA